MATYKYKNPNQQEVSLDLPNEGEIFRNPNDPLQGEIFKRQGQALLRLGEQQFRGANNASVRLGNILPQYGINFGSIREVSPESLDILQNKLGYTFRPGQISDFQSSNPQNTGESYRQGIDPNNLNQGNIISNTGAVSRFTPSPITTTGEISGMGKIEPLGNQQAPSGFNMQDRNSQIQALQSGINTTANNLRQTSQQRGVGLVPQFTQQFEGQSTLPPILPQTGTPQPTMTGTPGMAGAGSPTTGQSLQDQFFQTLIDQMKPTSEETALKDKQTSLDTQLRNLNQGQGVMNANIEDQPIALPFITGQQSAVEKRYALQRGDVANQQMTVQQKLANEIAKRQSSVDISKAQLKYQQGKEKIAADVAAADKKAASDLELEKLKIGTQEKKTQSEQNIALKKFNEDVRQFGLEHAQRQQKIDKEKSDGTGISPYRQERVQRIITSVDDLMGRTNYATVGVGSYLNLVRGTPQYNYYSDLETLKANISFSELTAMREASKTGGALGQIAVRELELLESTLGALRQGQSPSNMKANLQKIKDSLSRWDNAQAGQKTGQTSEKPQQMDLNGKILNLQSDGTYQ